MKAGGRAWTPGVGWLAIESVERVAEIERLSDADARADGFASAGEMLAALKSMYPQHRADGRSWFRISFRREEVVGPSASSEKSRAAVGGESGAAKREKKSPAPARKSPARKSSARKSSARKPAARPSGPTLFE